MSPQLGARSTVIYCTTRAQRAMVIVMAPQITPRTFCLNQAGDVLDPVRRPLEAYRRCVQHIRAWSELRYASCPAPSPADVQRVRAIQTQQDFLSVITSRHCKRAFVDQPVSLAILIEILRSVAHAPSSRNAQMWGRRW